MLLPVDLESKVFKSGINGYDKKDVDTFMLEIQEDYNTLYKDNHELTAKVEHLTEALNQYKGIEKSLQRALVLAQKASDDVKEQANQQAKLIEEEARYKAKMIIADANTQLDQMQSQTLTLLRQFELYKAQYKQLVSTQLDILSGDSFNIDMARFSNLSLPPSQDYEKTSEDSSNRDEINHNNINNNTDNYSASIPGESKVSQDQELEDIDSEIQIQNLENTDNEDEKIQIQNSENTKDTIQIHGLDNSEENVQIQDLDRQLADEDTESMISSDTTIEIKGIHEKNNHQEEPTSSTETSEQTTPSSREHMPIPPEDGLLAPITRERGYYDVLSEMHGDKHEE